MSYIEIFHDSLYISDRIKEIDKDYFILFNLTTQKYEVHCRAQNENSYCFTIPYDHLDSRTIDYCLKSRSQNLDEIIKEMEKCNESLVENSKKEIINKAKEVLS